MNAKPINSQHQKQTQQSFLLLLFEREREREAKPNSLNDKKFSKGNTKQAMFQPFSTNPETEKP